MDEIDARLLNIMQSGFPIDEHPYRELGKQLGIDETEALDRIRALVESGIIRRIGASFDTRKLGSASTLVAAKVPAERLQEVADIVSSFREVTHNYGRDFEYNLWFTLVCRDDSRIERVLNEIRQRTNIDDMHSLPAEKMFKIRVEFEL